MESSAAHCSESKTNSGIGWMHNYLFQFGPNMPYLRQIAVHSLWIYFDMTKYLTLFSPLVWQNSLTDQNIHASIHMES